MTGSPTECFTLACVEDLFAGRQVAPRTAVSLALTGWAHWLVRHGLGHAVLADRHRTAFVPVSVHVDYPAARPVPRADTCTVSTTVQTWQPPDFPACQEARVGLSVRGSDVVHVLVQTVCVRTGPAAGPGALPAALEEALLTPERAGHPPPRLLGRTPPRLTGTPLYAGHHFAVRGRRAARGTGWRAHVENVPDLIGAARESLVLTQAPRLPVLLPGLNRPLTRVRYGLRRPYGPLRGGAVSTSAHRVGDEVWFLHELRTAEGRTAGHALETVPVRRPDPGV